MALTYNIKFKRKIEENQQFKELLKSSKNDIILMYPIITSDRFYIDSLFEDNTISLDLGTSSFISFDVLKKEEDPYKIKKLLLEFINKIVNEIYPEEDYYFTFNGDIIYEMREDGIIKRNSNSNFYKGMESL